MKELRKILIQLFTAYWLIYVLSKCLLNYFEGDEMEVVDAMLLGLGWGLFPSLGSYYGLSQVVMPKLRYLESEGLEEPPFFEKRTESVPNENGAITFADLEESCRKSYVVTFVHRDEGTIKMRTKLSFWSWGVGYFVRFDDASQAITIVSIPISTRNRRVEQDVKRLRALVEGGASNGLC